jgi:hypothetical protein
VIRELRVAGPSERTAIIGKNYRDDQACLEKRSGQPHIGLVPNGVESVQAEVRKHSGE